MKNGRLDADTEKAVMSFLALIVGSYDIVGAIVYGSRARGTHRPDSDADIAVVIKGGNGNRTAVAMEMAGIAFGVMLDTGVLVEALPLWEDEWEHPETNSNPALLENIRNEGIQLTMPDVSAT